MLNIQTWWSTTLDSIVDFWGIVSEFILPIIGALVILYIGWFIGRFLEKLIKLVAGNLNADKILADSGFTKFLTTWGITFSIAEILAVAAWAVKWFFYASFFTAAMSVLALTSVNTFVGEAAAFFPKALTGALFIFVGVLLGGFLRTLLQRFLNSFRMPGSEITGEVAYWVVVVFAFLAMLNHFAVALDAIWNKALDMFVIAGGIAVGIGFSGRFADLFGRLKKGL